MMLFYVPALNTDKLFLGKVQNEFRSLPYRIRFVYIGVLYFFPCDCLFESMQAAMTDNMYGKIINNSKIYCSEIMFAQGRFIPPLENYDP